MTRPARNRLVGAVAVAVVLLALGVVAPEIYSGTFSDAGTFTRVAGLVAVLAVYGVAVRRLVGREWLSIGLIAIPVAVVLAVVVWPYVRPPTEVDEAFPVARTATASPTTAVATTVPNEAVAPSSTVDVTTPGSVAGTDPSPASTAPTTTPAPPEPLELRRAGFQGLTGHRGSGDAALYDLGDGTVLLRFEEVDIGSGPDLDVYLVPGPDQRGIGGGVFVASLTAERGNQNYDVPDGVDLARGTWTVLVWCETFDVEVANATFGA